MSLVRSEDLKIVVVDDSDFSRSSIIEIIERHGFTVSGQAASAEDAIALLASGANVFIIDIVMPEVSGLELSKILTENTKDLKIIMMSSLDSESIVIESISSGAIDFLAKPFTEKDLISSLEKIDSDLKEEA